MTDLLLAKAHTGQAEPLTHDAYIRRVGGEPRLLIASLLAVAMEKPISFPKGDDVYIVRAYDPQWQNLRFVDMVDEAIPIAEFRQNDTGRIVHAPDGKEGLGVFRFTGRAHYPTYVTLMIAARSSKEAMDIASEELKRVAKLTREDRANDPFWKLALRDIHNCGDSHWDNIEYMHRSDFDMDFSPKQIFGEKPCLEWSPDAQDASDE